MGKRNKPTKKYNPDILKPYRPKKKKKKIQTEFKAVILETRVWSKIFKGHPPTKDSRKKRGGGQNSILVQKLDQST